MTECVYESSFNSKQNNNISFQQEQDFSNFNEEQKELTIFDLGNNDSNKKQNIYQKFNNDSYKKPNVYQDQNFTYDKINKNIFCTANFEENIENEIPQQQPFTSSFSSNNKASFQNYKNYNNSEQSDFDLSQSKLNKLENRENENTDKEIQNYSNLIKNYTKQFKSNAKDPNNYNTTRTTRVNSQIPTSKEQSTVLNKYGQFLTNNNSNSNIYVNSKSNMYTETTKISNIKNDTKIYENSVLNEKIKTFNNKLQEAQNDFSSSKYSQDPYKISLHSIHSLQTINKELDSSATQQDKSSASFYSRGSKANNSTNQKPPIANLAKIFGQDDSIRQIKNRSVTNNGIQVGRIQDGSNMEQQLELLKIKYFDQFLPTDMKIMNSSFKLLKHKIYNREKNQLTNCMNELKFMNKELSNNFY